MLLAVCSGVLLDGLRSLLKTLGVFLVSLVVCGAFLLVVGQVSE